jgi:hypothetical protein
LATKWAPSEVAPPALFSTTIGWPSRCESAATKVRVTTSVPEPARSGTTTWMALSWACAVYVVLAMAHATIAMTLLMRDRLARSPP